MTFIEKVQSLLTGGNNGLSFQQMIFQMRNKRPLSVFLLPLILLYTNGTCLSRNPAVDHFIMQSTSLYPEDTLPSIKLTGQILTIFNESADSVSIEATLENIHTTAHTLENGSFAFEILPDAKSYGHELSLRFYGDDYQSFDTVFIVKKGKKYEDLIIRLIPKYKILLKGRIYAGNSPLEGVDVNVLHAGKVQHLKTLDCYVDDEDYWNCLFLGMFKTEITTENPRDSIALHMSKLGFEPQDYKLKFSEYSGDLLRFRMRYADSIPDLPGNSLSLRLSFPVGKNAGWFFSLSYYRQLFPEGFNRFSAGWEFTTYSYKQHLMVRTLAGLEESQFDTTYVDIFTGPSAILYLTKPARRYFATYLGATLMLSVHNSDILIQPFAGTRIYLDMRKSLSLELRYISYNLDIKEYTFNYLGNASARTKTISINKLLVNAGIQVNF